MLSNPTPRVISTITSSILSLIVIAITIAFNDSWYEILIEAGLIFLCSYLMTLFALDFFIYKKIKLIYKSIHQVKTGQEWSFYSFPFNNKANPIQKVTQDVLDWTEKQQIEMEQLRKNDTYRKEFLGNVSHELKTPIFNIQGYINTLLDGAINDPEVNIPFLNKASKSTDRLAALVEDLESISKLESGYLTMEMEVFDIYELVKDVFDSMQIRADESSIKFKFANEPHHPIWVDADKQYIRQVLINLIGNSIKYGKEKGCTKVAFYDMDEHILIEVSDNGIGVSNEHLHRLFERFYRVDRSRSRLVGGTGLGLAIVKHIIEAHNQSISVNSKIGVGTTFSFTLRKSYKYMM